MKPGWLIDGEGHEWWVAGVRYNTDYPDLAHPFQSIEIQRISADGLHFSIRLYADSTPLYKKAEEAALSVPVSGKVF